MDLASQLRNYRPDWLTVAVWATILLVEAILLVAYLRSMNARLLPLHIYPFIWINLSIWVLWRTPLPDAPKRTKRIGMLVSGAYFLVLAYFGGFLREGHGFHSHGDIPTEELVTGTSIWLQVPPGYGPMFTYSGEFVLSSISPYLLFGFVALTYLMYVTILDASGEASVGLVGLFSCVGCSFPLITALVTGGATTTAVGAFIYSQTYVLSTVVFVLTVLFLYWRPFKTNSVRSVILAVGIVFVLISGTIHLGMGLSGLVDAATTGGGEVVLSALFVAVALAAYLVVGGYVTEKLPRVQALTLGAGLMAVVFVLYFDYHLFGTLDAVLPLDNVGLEHDHSGHDLAHDNSHAHTPFAQVGELLRADLLALLSKSTEFLAALFLGIVAVQEWIDDSRHF